MKRCLLSLVLLSLGVFVHAAGDSGASSRRILTRDDCLQMGLAESLELRMLELEVASASADVVRVSAVYDPQVELGGEWEDSELPPGYIPTGGGVERGLANAGVQRTLSTGTRIGAGLDVQRNLFEGFAASSEPVWRTAATLSLRQSLWRNAFGASDRHRVAFARQRLDTLAAEYRQRREDLAANILDTYWRAVQARQVAETQQQVLERLRKLLERHRAYVADGLLDETAALAVEASLAVAEVDAVTLHYEAEMLDEELKERIRLPSSSWDTTEIRYEIPDSDDPLPVAWLDAYEEALHYRADLEALRHEEQRLGELIRAAELDDRGDLEVGGSVGRGDDADAFEETWGFDKTLWSVGATYRLALGRSATRAEVMQAMIQREQVRVRREMLESEIELACRAAVRQVDTAGRLVPATAKALAAQERKLELEGERFARGQSDTRTLLDYENDRDLAERDRVRARVAYQRALLNLARARGVVVGEAAP